MGMTRTNVAMRLSLLAAAVAGTVGITAGSAGAAPAHPAIATAVVGKYTYNDSFGDKGEGLTLNANGTAVFSSGCTGLWVKSGSAIALDINANCSSTWIFSGTITATGLSSKSNPGHVVTFGPARKAGTWYATHA